MYEIAHRGGVTARELAEDLKLDPGYLSRLLKGFEAKKLLTRRASEEDGRRQHLRLTPLERRQRKEVRNMLAKLDDGRRGAVLAAMEVIRSAFDNVDQAVNVDPHEPQVSVRGHRPGDIGWVIQRHAEIHHPEHGWDESFEALVAEVAVAFLRNLDPARERCWIAEHDGRRAGCIFLVSQDATTAKLRLLLVEPAARGLGIGRRLVTECVRFARAAGYRNERPTCDHT